jgi:hypothetical protein
VRLTGDEAWASRDSPRILGDTMKGQPLAAAIGRHARGAAIALVPLVTQGEDQRKFNGSAASMAPPLDTSISLYAAPADNIQRGDVVVFTTESWPDQRTADKVVKRVVGIGGDPPDDRRQRDRPVVLPVVATETGPLQQTRAFIDAGPATERVVRSRGLDVSRCSAGSRCSSSAVWLGLRLRKRSTE